MNDDILMELLIMVTLDEFKAAREKELKKKYELFVWLKKKEQEYNIEKVVPRDFNTIPLYHNATYAFINECYLASILAIGSAIEQFLLWQVIKQSKLHERMFRKDFYKLIQSQLSEELIKELQNFLTICRDEVAHPKTRQHFSALGLPYNLKEGDFGGPDVEPITLYIDSKNRLIIGYECAIKGLELFMKIVRFIIDKKTKV